MIWNDSASHSFCTGTKSYRSIVLVQHCLNIPSWRQQQPVELSQSAAATMLAVFFQRVLQNFWLPHLNYSWSTRCSSSTSCMADWSYKLALILQLVSTSTVNSPKLSWHSGADMSKNCLLAAAIQKRQNIFFHLWILDKSYELQIDSLYCTFPFSYICETDSWICSQNKVGQYLLMLLPSVCRHWKRKSVFSRVERVLIQASFHNSIEGNITQMCPKSTTWYSIFFTFSVL